MRGVHGDHHLDEPACKGSSPHARGPRIQNKSSKPLVRIIPACAGSTLQSKRPDRPQEDHPRMRGVHLVVCCPPSLSLGSSPHARGPLDAFHDAPVTIRIIPACAGSTCSVSLPPLSIKDHPRMRGVHTPMPPELPPDPGSSPHARGPLAYACSKTCTDRIIPACAGSTF